VGQVAETLHMPGSLTFAQKAAEGLNSFLVERT
jgi:hypothetical protein